MELRDIKNEVLLRDYSASIKISGDIKAEFIVSVDESLAKELVRKFVFGELKEMEIKDYINDTIAEITNTILGNSINLISEYYEIVNIEPATTIFSTENLIRAQSLEISVCQLETEIGYLDINFLRDKSLD